MSRILFIVLFLQISLICWGQNAIPNIQFVANENQRFGFSDVPNSSWKEKFPWVKEKDRAKKYVSVKILGENETDWVTVICNDTAGTDWNEIDFFFGDKLLIPKIISPREAYLKIESPQKAFELGAYLNDRPIARMRTIICKKLTRKVVVIPLVNDQIDQSTLDKKVNSIFQQSNTSVQIEWQKPFSSKVFNSESEFGLPDWNENRYTGQMRLLRDQYFDKYPFADKESYYIFLIPSYTDSSKLAYTIPYKNLGFVPFQSEEKLLSKQIAKTLAIGIAGLLPSWNEGPEKGTSSNLMDTSGGNELEFFQIERLQNTDFFFSVRDAYEFVRTGNGTVAYYFWQEDENGNLIWNGKSMLSAIKTPFKKNFLVYRFNLESPLMRPLFRWGKYYISILNYVFVVVAILVLFVLRRLIKNFWIKRNWRTFPRRLLFWMKLGVTAWVIYLSFSWGNSLLDRYTLLSGPLPEFSGKKYAETKKALFSISDFRKKSEYGMSSEILIQKDEDWRFKRLKKVLYFEIKPNRQGEMKLSFKTSKNKLKLELSDYKSDVQNHYFVCSTYSDDGELVKEDVYLFNKKKIERIEEQENLPRRILVFVNGYRPTSTGKTVQENFQGIQEKGFEYPNSTNHVYDFDRYEYWEPWGEINLKFQSKINPSATFYADGHFSVTTSNYKSLLNFSSVSQIYPKRCADSTKHVCHTVQNNNFWRFLNPTSKTEDLLNMYANTSGFNYRRNKGKIAGWNVLQKLNQYPGFSENDTLYIVAHSMGYAYSLGMIETMRDKINFGGYYIIAPENAKSGRIRASEWQELWQYGSRFGVTNDDAPCLQDGVAPQSKARGLDKDARVFIPQALYARKGFFDSHFIGYYDWILQIQEGNKGYIKQR